VDRELSLCERLWRWLFNLCGGPDFTFQMFEGIPISNQSHYSNSVHNFTYTIFGNLGINIVEIDQETMSIDSIPCTMHRALRRLQEEVA